MSDLRERSTDIRLTRRRWLLVSAGALGAMAAACAPTTAPAPTAAPAKPTEAPKPAPTTAAAKPTEAAPAAAPAATAAPAAKTAAQAKPAAMTPASQVMNWFAQSSQAGFFAALKNGDYEKLNIQMTNEQGGPQIAAVPLVASGKHTFGMAQADQVLLAREEGIPVVAVFGTFSTNPQGLMFHNSNPVKDFPDLNGRKVYVSPTATYWQYFVNKFKLDRVEQLAYNGQLPIFLADETAVFQCYVSSEPPVARQQGADPGYLLNADSGFNPYGNLIFTMEQTVKDKPELVQAYVAASVQGWRSYADNPRSILEYIVSDFRKDYDIPLALQAAEVEKPLLTGKSYDSRMLGMMTEERWKTLHDQMREVGVLKKDVDYKAAFSSRFVEEANKA